MAIVDLVAAGTGVQHSAARYWQPWEPGDIAARAAVIEPHVLGGEPVARFTSRRPVSLADVG